MRFVPVSPNAVAMVDDADYDTVAAYNWRLHKTRKGGRYAVRGAWNRSKKQSQPQPMHALILGVPFGTMVDHRNRDTLDNTRQNLRVCNASQNQANSPKESGRFASRYKGVTWHKRVGKWQASIKVNGRSHYLGLFSDEVSAAKAYDAAASRHFGEFALPNFGGAA